MRRQRWWRWGWVIVLGAMACETTSAQIKKDDNQVIGRPPERAEDPFADDVLPPDASQTSTAGVMDVPSSKPPKDDAPQKTDPKPPQIAVKTEPKTQPNIQPKTRVDPETAPDAPVGHQCYSCVRICPKQDTSSDCSESKEDMICGWGTAPTKEDASRLAQGQCTAALNLVRDAPQWSSISGGCPVASCR